MTSKTETRLANFPLAFFAIVMGMSGLSIAWLKSAAILHFSEMPGTIMAGLALVLYLIIIVLYTAKFIKHRDAVKADLAHPVKLNFFATITISLLLLTVCANHLVPAASPFLFVFGAIVHLGVTFYILNSWIQRTGIDVIHLNPAWFIPVVGNIVVPVAMPKGFPADIGIFCFSIGLVFWLSLLSVVLNRLFFHHPIPERLLPTLAILIAPPAIAFLAYFKLTGHIDFGAKIFLAMALFFTLFLGTQIPRLSRIPFALSWWAYSFPLTAATTASMVYFKETDFLYMKTIALALLCISTLVILLLSVKTIKAIRGHTICIPEPGH